MIAFVSDIHSNTEALTAVIAEARRVGATRFVCLGDVIGYGPEPRETLLQVMDLCEYSLLGNHEHGAMYYASDFNPRARAAIDWTRDQLNRRDRPRDENMRSSRATRCWSTVRRAIRSASTSSRAMAPTRRR
jgi:hypothetical protein